MVKHTQIIRRQQLTNCLSVFDHFFGLVLKVLTLYLTIQIRERNVCTEQQLIPRRKQWWRKRGKWKHEWKKWDKRSCGKFRKYYRNISVYISVAKVCVFLIHLNFCLYLRHLSCNLFVLLLSVGLDSSIKVHSSWTANKNNH